MTGRAPRPHGAQCDRAGHPRRADGGHGAVAVTGEEEVGRFKLQEALAHHVRAPLERQLVGIGQHLRRVGETLPVVHVLDLVPSLHAQRVGGMHAHECHRLFLGKVESCGSDGGLSGHRGERQERPR